MEDFNYLFEGGAAPLSDGKADIPPMPEPDYGYKDEPIMPESAPKPSGDEDRAAGGDASEPPVESGEDSGESSTEDDELKIVENVSEDSEGWYKAAAECGLEGKNFLDMSSEERARVNAAYEKKKEETSKEENEGKKLASFGSIGKKAASVALLCGIGLGGLIWAHNRKKEVKAEEPRAEITQAFEEARDEGMKTGAEAVEAAEKNEDKENREKFRFTDQHLYYYEDEKMNTHESTTGVTSESFARGERLVHDAYDSDLTQEEHALFEKGDKKAPGYEAAVKKLYAESIMRVCTDSREAEAAYMECRIKANPEAYPEFKGLNYKQIVEKLYEQDDEKNKELLKKNYDEYLNAKYEEVTVNSRVVTYKEVDNKGKDPNRQVTLEKFSAKFEKKKATKITFADGSTMYVFLLAENSSWEMDTNKKEKRFVVRDNNGKIVHECAQPFVIVQAKKKTKKKVKIKVKRKTTKEKKNYKAAVDPRRAGNPDHNTKLNVSGPAEDHYDPSY